MKLLQKSLFAIPVIIIAIALLGFFLPNNYEISRRIVVEASPAEVHSMVANLENWVHWNPWQTQDADMLITIGELSQGVGASQSWQGEKGSGKLVFTKVEPNRSIDYDLSFDESMHAKANIAYLPGEENDNSTEIIWEMQGTIDTPVIGSLFALIIRKMVAKDFDQGLDNLKQALEAS